MILVVDTGPLVATFNKNDRAHAACTELLATTSAQLIVPAPVLTEVCYLVETRNGTRAEAAFLTELARGTMTLEPQPHPTSLGWLSWSRSTMIFRLVASTHR